MTVEKTPNIIHFLWLDKDFSGEGILNKNLNFFKDIIYKLHPNYTINFVNDRKTVDQDIEKEGDEYSWIKNVLNSEFVSAAHKSDVMRFFYLYTMGGVWLDITTFLLESFDDLINKNNLGFSCYYMPQKLAQSKMMGWEFLHNLIPYPNFVNITNSNITNSGGNEEPLFSSINPEYKEFDFIPENYFIISRKEHPICKSILDMFKLHYKNVKKISNDEEKGKLVNDYHNEYMYDLFNEVFNPDEGILKELNYQIKELPEHHKKDVLRKIFSLTGGGSYLFNYLMMFIAIASHSKEHDLKKLTVISEDRESVINNNLDNNNPDNELADEFRKSRQLKSAMNVWKNKYLELDDDTLKQIAKERERPMSGLSSKPIFSEENPLSNYPPETDINTFIESANKYKKYVCDQNSCRDILLGKRERKGNLISINKLKLDENEVYLMSAQYIRLTKWSNSLVDRLKTWDNTPIKPLLTMTEEEISSPKKIYDKYNNLMKTLKKLDITQIKFSGFTRNSPMVKNLRKITEGYNEYEYKISNDNNTNTSATEEKTEEGAAAGVAAAKQKKEKVPKKDDDDHERIGEMMGPQPPPPKNPNYVIDYPDLPKSGPPLVAMPKDDKNLVNNPEGGKRHIRKHSNNSRKIKRKHKNNKFMTKVKNKKTKNKKTKNKKTKNKKTTNKKTKNKKTKSKSR